MSQQQQQQQRSRRRPITIDIDDEDIESLTIQVRWINSMLDQIVKARETYQQSESCDTLPIIAEGVKYDVMNEKDDVFIPALLRHNVSALLNELNNIYN